MITSSAALLTLDFAGSQLAWPAFRVLWISNVATYIFITGFALLIDTGTARRTWRQGAMFPGVVNMAIIADTCFPRLLREAARTFFAGSHLTPPHVSWVIAFVYAWLGGSMAVAWLAKAALPRRLRGTAVRPHVRLLHQELRGAEMSWDKTEKTGKMTIPT